MSSLHTRLSEARARQALRTSDLPFQGALERASSTRNEIYLSDRYVVRINSQANQRLRREAELYRYLPRRPWAPQAVAMGGELGADYLIVARKPGAPLAHQWPDLTPQQRRGAVVSLADRLKAIHATRVPATLAHLEATPHLIDPAANPIVRPLIEGLERLGAAPGADPGIVRAALDCVGEHRRHLGTADTSRLIHGDLTFENLLFDGSAISAVIDFEWCRGGPPDLDLDVLLRCCALPEAHVGLDHQARTRAEDYADVPVWLARAYPSLFGHPNLFERLLVYALSFEVRLALTVPIPAARPDNPDDHPYSRLGGLVSSGGYLARILDRVGVAS